jgi:hypothetical protein
LEFLAEAAVLVGEFASTLPRPTPTSPPSPRPVDAMAIIVKLSPITRGWAAYYRTVVSAEVFSALDHYVFKLTYKWAKYRHPNKSKRWIVGRYFGKFTKQDGHCPLCGDHLLTADQPPQSPQQWERWWLQVTRKAIVADYLVHHGRPGPAGRGTTRLVHASCHRGLQARQRRNPVQLTCTPRRLA